MWWLLLLEVPLFEQMVEAEFAMEFECSVACNKQTTSLLVFSSFGCFLVRTHYSVVFSF